MSSDKLIVIGKFDERFKRYVDFNPDLPIVQSSGLKVHIEKRHPECVQYISEISEIIASPDYIGTNPRESVLSFELIKVISDNVLIGIKLAPENNYFYVATLHTITSSKLKKRIESGRLKAFDN